MSKKAGEHFAWVWWIQWVQCTMLLAIEIRERKNCKSKWLDFAHFSTNYYFFGLYCCETANIQPEK